MSKRWTGRGWLVGGAAFALLVGAAASTRAEGTTAASGSNIDSQAQQYLKQCCSYLASLQNFSFRVDETIQEVNDDGQKIDYSNRRHVTIARPNRLRVDSTGDTANRLFVYDGKTVTLYDKEHNVYGTDKAPDTIDAMLEQMNQRFGYTPPLADFYFADPYKALTEDVQSGAYAGDATVGDTKCHHLVFRQKTIDWQLWVTEGDKPLPRKLVITYKREANGPDFTAVFAHWDTNVNVNDEMFEFKPPAGATKIGFVDVHQEATQGKPAPGK